MLKFFGKITQSCVSILAVSALSACGGGGSSSGGTSAPTSTADTVAPTISFNPSEITIEAGLSVEVLLNASDNVGVVSGPTVVCVGEGTGGDGTFSNNTFTAPSAIFTFNNVCTATVSDAAGNQSEATLTATITPPSDFSRVSDTITTDPVLGFINIPTEPARLVGLTKNASTGSVSSFTTSVIDLGEFDDADLTAQSTLGTIGTPPLDTLFFNTSDVVGNLFDLVVLDEVNDELVAISLDVENMFGVPETKSVPNACAAGRGALRDREELNGVRKSVTDILVGTTNGLFHIGAGNVNEDGNGSGLSEPTLLVAEGNFCTLFVDSFVTDTIYAVYDQTTGIISAYQGSGDNAESYELEFTSDISDSVPVNAEHILIDGFQDGFGLDTIYNVFKNSDGGTTLIQSTTGRTERTTNYDLDIENPTDILVFDSSGRERVVLVSPTSERAAYIPNADSSGNEVEYFDIGLGFDQVDYSEDAFSLTFSSSTQGNVIVRRRM